MTIQIQFRISNKIHVAFPQDFMNTSNKSFSFGNIEGTKEKKMASVRNTSLAETIIRRCVGKIMTLFMVS